MLTTAEDAAVLAVQTPRRRRGDTAVWSTAPQPFVGGGFGFRWKDWRFEDDADDGFRRGG